MNKLYQLAIAATAISLGFVVGAVKPASAVTADFDISGSLQGGDTFSGTYSIDNVETASDTVTSLSAFNVNVVNPSTNQSVETFSSTTPVSFGNIYGNYVGDSAVNFFNGTTGDGITIYFSNAVTSLEQPLSGMVESESFFSLEDGTVTGGITGAQVTSAQPVPEPLTMGGTVVAGGIGWLMKRKSAAANKAKA